MADRSFYRPPICHHEPIFMKWVANIFAETGLPGWAELVRVQRLAMEFKDVR